MDLPVFQTSEISSTVYGYHVFHFPDDSIVQTRACAQTIVISFLHEQHGMYRSDLLYFHAWRRQLQHHDVTTLYKLIS
jgi:hypothetical protein